MRRSEGATPVTASLKVTVILVSAVTCPGAGETWAIRGGPGMAAKVVRAVPRHHTQANTMRTIAFTSRFRLNGFYTRFFQPPNVRGLQNHRTKPELTGYESDKICDCRLVN